LSKGWRERGLTRAMPPPNFLKKKNIKGGKKKSKKYKKKYKVKIKI
jgi:hypothetical protein